MSPPENAKPVYRFGHYVADVRAGELFKRGKKNKVQQQPMQVLAALLEKAGEVVTREELRAGIWPADTFVDFEHSLNTAIKKLRKALGDNATRPKYIETLPRRGYRFLGRSGEGGGSGLQTMARSTSPTGRERCFVGGRGGI